MTVKIVKGLINKADPAQNVAKQTGQKANASKATQQASANSAKLSNSEAVITTVNSQKQLAPTEKLKSHKEAKGIAQDVANMVRSGGGLEAHALGSVSGRDLLV